MVFAKIEKTVFYEREKKFQLYKAHFEAFEPSYNRFSVLKSDKNYYFAQKFLKLSETCYDFRARFFYYL